MRNRFLEAGRLENTHGIRGALRLRPWADDADFLLGFKTLYIDGAAYEVESSSVHKGLLIVTFAGIGSVNEAMRLKGKTVSIDREDAKLPDGAFFLADIMGARVVTEDGTPVGTLSDAIELPGGRVYLVRGETGAERLIPARPEFVVNTDVDAGVITVRLIEGL